VTAGLVIGLVAALVIGLALGWLARAQRHHAAETAHAEERAHLQAQLAGEQARQAELARSEAERAATREEDRRLLQGTFAELSLDALAKNTEQFLLAADQRLKQAQETATVDLQQRHEAIAQLLQPLHEALQKYEVSLEQLEKDRQEAYLGLSRTVTDLDRTQAQLQKETRNLVTALRSPQTRGRWGELQLRRVVELAGMLEHCDFDQQVTVSGDDGRYRPDMVVHLTGGAVIVVDAKVPLDAYLRVLDADTEEQRRSELTTHARQVRDHVDQMAKKQYWKLFEGSAEFMVVFVPGDAILAAAYDCEPDLQEYANAKGVLLTTPTMLIALLRTAAFGWRQEVLAGNARQVQLLGAELYGRLRTMGTHLGKVQRSLTSTVKAFNDAIGSFDSRVMVTARKFSALGAAPPGDELVELDGVATLPRLPQAPDLLVDASGSDPNPAALPPLDRRDPNL
jgi:DNA recombination protein RmuC